MLKLFPELMLPEATDAEKAAAEKRPTADEQPAADEPPAKRSRVEECSIAVQTDPEPGKHAPNKQRAQGTTKLVR